MGDLTENFSRSEIECKCGCGENRISMDLMARSQIVRTVVGVPLTVTSGARCMKHNLAEGGDEDSEHVPTDENPCEGLDIKCTTSGLRWQLLKVGVLLFNRIGVGDDFIHFGIRSSKPQEVIWQYYD